jgi:hypothetical protein
VLVHEFSKAFAMAFLDANVQCLSRPIALLITHYSLIIVFNYYLCTFSSMLQTLQKLKDQLKKDGKWPPASALHHAAVLALRYYTVIHCRTSFSIKSTSAEWSKETPSTGSSIDNAVSMKQKLREEKDTGALEVAFACLSLANKALRLRSNARPLKRYDLLTAAYEVQHPGREALLSCDDVEDWEVRCLGT